MCQIFPSFSPISFNLVIEILFFSSIHSSVSSLYFRICFNLVIEILFFSRDAPTMPQLRTAFCFNLVIEILFFSSPLHEIYIRCCRLRCFNLVIEILFFSRTLAGARIRTSIQFQSRNRDTFLFKSRPSEPLPHVPQP